MKALQIAAALVCVAGCVLAQDDATPKPDAGTDKVEPAEPPAHNDHRPGPEKRPVRRDPTAGAGGTVGWGSATRRSEVNVPPIKLRARVFVKGKPNAALLLVGESVHVVREGSVIALFGQYEITSSVKGATMRRDGKGQTAERMRKTTLNLKVTKIDATGVHIEVPEHDPLILR